MLLHPATGATLIGADCLAALRKLPAARFDSVVTDPPYELGFMGKSWDASGIAYSVELWREVLRVLKPGGHLLAFGATRTYHRMACAIEDAGFEIRDSLHWLYGTGFPKSLNVSKAIDSARVEDVEPVRVVCRTIRAAMDARGLKASDLAPFFGGVHPRMIDHWAARDTDSQPNLPTWDQWLELRRVLAMDPDLDAEVRRLNDRKGQRGDAYQGAEVIGVIEKPARAPAVTSILSGAVDPTLRAPATDAARQWAGWGTALKPAHEPIVMARRPLEGTVAENVQRWGTGAINVDACRIETTDDPADRTRLAGGVKGKNALGHSEPYDPHAHPAGRWPANVLLDEHAAAELDAQSGELRARGNVSPTKRPAAQNATSYAIGASPGAVDPGDSGGASRFFYVAKPSRAERDLGCDHLPKRSGGEATERADDSAGVRNPRAGANRGGGAANYHPTVKPIALMRHLVRLVTPPGGVVLDPFVGSGTTGIAARLEGLRFVGIEREREYLTIAEARIRGAA